MDTPNLDAAIADDNSDGAYDLPDGYRPDSEIDIDDDAIGAWLDAAIAATPDTFTEGGPDDIAAHEGFATTPGVNVLRFE